MTGPPWLHQVEWHLRTMLGRTVGRTHTTQHEHVAAMREEIGQQHVAQAKAELPKLERIIQKEVRPWLARITGLQAKAPTPLPPSVQAWITETQKLSDVVPNTIRHGLDGWDRLTPPIWTDGKSLDLHACAQLISDIRFCLRNWDGVAERLGHLGASVEQYISDSGWPSTQPNLTDTTP